MKRAHYETLARHDLDYWWFRTRHDVVLRLLAARRRNDMLIDIGCGTGGFLRRCLDDGSYAASEVLGLDVDAASVAIAIERGVPASVMSHRTPTQDDVPDPPGAMTALDVLEHLDDPVSMLQSMRAIAAPGCALVALVPALQSLWSPWDDRLGHRRRYDRRMLRDHVADAGWDVQQVRYLFPSMVLPGAVRARLLRSDKLPADEFPPVAGWVNWMLHALTSMEARFPAWPLGSSLAIVATNPSPA
ncbi:MAG: class I SAM-dependent methyltransferase [Phycisphaerales bacterium]|jgi:SAM-dependent methyltransferase|nr:class I SAM-dependent methyltransferase [Phycisphaerales bacterium]